MLQMSIQSPFLLASVPNMLIGSTRLNHQFVDKAKLATPGMESFVEKLPAEEISEESAILNASVRISAPISYY